MIILLLFFFTSVVSVYNTSDMFMDSRNTL